MLSSFFATDVRGTGFSLTRLSLPHGFTGSPFPGHNLMFTACSNPLIIALRFILPRRRDDTTSSRPPFVLPQQRVSALRALLSLFLARPRVPRAI